MWTLINQVVDTTQVVTNPIIMKQCENKWPSGKKEVNIDMFNSFPNIFHQKSAANLYQFLALLLYISDISERFARRTTRIYDEAET